MWMRETGNGGVRYCERYTDYLTGKTRDVSVTFPKDTVRNRKEAQKMLAERIAKKQTVEVKQITLDDLIDEYLKDQRRSVRLSTYQRNSCTMGTIKKMLGGDVLVDRVTARYIREKFLDSGKKNATLNEYLRRLRALFRWGYQNDLVKDIHFLTKLENFQDTPHRIKIAEKYLETDELRLVLSRMKQPVWAMLTEFLALSGLRVGEAIALEMGNIDLNAKVIHITKTYDSINRIITPAKTDHSIDDVVIQPQLETVIRKIESYMRRQMLVCRYKTKLFLSDKKGEPINYYSFNKYFKENCEAAVGRPLTTHSLRHTHASLLFEQGFSLDEVSRRLRHGDSRITREVYIHVTKKLKEKDAAKIMAVNLL